jgi:hypothetical protein
LVWAVSGGSLLDRRLRHWLSYLRFALRVLGQLRLGLPVLGQLRHSRLWFGQLRLRRAGPDCVMLSQLIIG